MRASPTKSSSSEASGRIKQQLRGVPLAQGNAVLVAGIEDQRRPTAAVGWIRCRLQVAETYGTIVLDSTECLNTVLLVMFEDECIDHLAFQHQVGAVFKIPANRGSTICQTIRLHEYKYVNVLRSNNVAIPHDVSCP